MHKEFYNQFLIDYRAEGPLTQRLEGDALSFLSAMEQNIEAQLNEDLVRKYGLKYSQVLTVELEKLVLTADSVTREHGIRHRYHDGLLSE